MSNKKFDFWGSLEKFPAVVYAILAVVCLSAHVLICTFTSVLPAVCGLIMISVYLLLAVLVYFTIHKRISFIRMASDASEEQNNGVIYTFRNHLKIPYAVVTENGKIITVNSAMKQLAGVAAVFNADLKDICDLSIDDLISTTASEIDTMADPDEETEYELLKDKKAICTIGRKTFHVDCHPLNSKGKLFYLLMFNDITEFKNLHTVYTAEHTAVAYIVIDNLDEIAQYAMVS